MTSKNPFNVLQDNKDALRSIKGVAGKTQDAARNAMVQGVLDSNVYIQFGEDMRVYGLYEAFLYAAAYELQGHYADGTTVKAVNAALKSIK